MKNILYFATSMLVFSSFVSCDRESTPATKFVKRSFDYVIVVESNGYQQSCSLGNALVDSGANCSIMLNDFLLNKLKSNNEAEILVHVSIYKIFKGETGNGESFFKKLDRWSFKVERTGGIFVLRNYDSDEIFTSDSLESFSNEIKSELGNLISNAASNSNHNSHE